MESLILERLLVQNPWFESEAAWGDWIGSRVPGNFVPRAGMPSGGAGRDRVNLVVGPRQAGKSTWMWARLRERRPRELLYLNAEEPAVQQWASSAVQVASDLGREFPSVRSVFIDEVQHLREAGLFLKGLADARSGVEIWATGSSAFHLAARTRESLAGRARRHRLLTFSLDELLSAERIDVPAVRVVRARRLLHRLLVHGGYPRAWFSTDPPVELRDLIEAFVIRDASDRLGVTRPDVFRRLMQLAAGQIGQMVNLAEWAAHLGVAASTVRSYLGLLEDAWLVHLLPAFSGGRRRELTSATRIHFYDLGLRNALLGAFSPDVDLRQDRGALVEGWVFGELSRTLPPDATLHYWRAKGGAEMDFVVARGDRVVGVEVKAGTGRVSRSVRSFADAYRPAAIIVAGGTVTESREEALDGVPIRVCGLTEAARAVRVALGGAE